MKAAAYKISTKQSYAKNIFYAILCTQILVLTKAPKITVATPPPMKPSHVFFGDTLISGVRPKKNPKI